MADLEKQLEEINNQLKRIADNLEKLNKAGIAVRILQPKRIYP